MMHATIHVQLPTDALRRGLALVSWIGSLFGTSSSGDRAQAGAQRLSPDMQVVLASIFESARRAGFLDVVSVLCDRRSVYLDESEDRSDLQQALETTLSAPELARARSVDFVLSRRTAEIHFLARVELERYVDEGRASLTTTISARPSALRIRDGEDAPDFAARLRAWAADGPEIERLKQLVDEITESFAHALDETVEASQVTREPVRLDLVRPGRLQASRFRHLGFGARIRPPSYRARRDLDRDRGYDTPFYHHYFDPYYDLASWWLIEACLDGVGLNRPDLEIRDPQGRVLFRGDEAPARSADDFAVPRDSVSLHPTGRLVISEDIPHVQSLDSAELGSAHAPGFAGNYNENA